MQIKNYIRTDSKGENLKTHFDPFTLQATPMCMMTTVCMSTISMSAISMSSMYMTSKCSCSHN